MEDYNSSQGKQGGSVLLLVAILSALIILIGLIAFYIVKQNKNPQPASVVVPNREISTPGKSAEPISAHTQIDEQEVRDFISGWVYDWTNKDIISYASCYDPDKFVGYSVSTKKGRKEMNYNQWMEDKNTKFYETGSIHIELQNIVIKYMGNNVVEVKFDQYYYTEFYEDSGLKILRLTSSGNGWQIIFEDFQLYG